MAVSSDILRGHTETVILRLLLNEDSYGYDISRRITEVGEGLIDVKDATIYTAFRRLEQEGLITAYWGEGTTGARRRYYAITDNGRLYYEERKEEWLLVSKILNALIIGGSND